jgi:CrcB protein
MRLFFIVLVGSGIGGALRHLVGLVSLRLLGPSFPSGTLAINVFGSALMGLVIVVLSMRSGTSHELRVFLTPASSAASPPGRRSALTRTVSGNAANRRQR